jgi:hypothetical protein
MAKTTDLASLPKKTAKETDQHVLFVKVPRDLFQAYKSEIQNRRKTIRDDIINHLEETIRVGPTWRETLKGLGTRYAGLAGRSVNV